MAQFARDCMYKMWTMTKALKTTLRPETANLSMKVGLHSGPVMGGVLRGDHARLQLFGDTVNTVSCMKSTGQSSGIQMTKEIRLPETRKSKQIKPGENFVFAKGKGQMRTYFLEILQLQSSSSIYSSEEGASYVETDAEEVANEPHE
jgi:hypothetical protein